MQQSTSQSSSTRKHLPCLTKKLRAKTMEMQKLFAKCLSGTWELILCHRWYAKDTRRLNRKKSNLCLVQTNKLMPTSSNCSARVIFLRILAQTGKALLQWTRRCNPEVISVLTPRECRLSLKLCSSWRNKTTTLLTLSICARNKTSKKRDLELKRIKPRSKAKLRWQSRLQRRNEKECLKWTSLTKK